jgi:hypothetical protein
MANQNTLQSSTQTIRHWRFKRGHMDLTFSIDIEIKTDVVDMLDCLKKAVDKLEEELKNYGING